jgi:eukaryotic-like serine/threonine-protein kinase
MALTPGSKLGPYEIASSLGEGGMGEVYRARDTRLERTVAIKILPAQVSNDPVRKQRFEREAKTISSLNHPNICTLYDIGSQDGVDYLVMECVEGETLAKRLEKGPLALDQVLKYGAQLADALDKAHRAGIVHRDLKPGNIMLTASGAKLLDFGLAKPAAQVSAMTLTAAATQPTPVTQEGMVVGTFQYMSPEQVEGKELDGRTDIFSLGAVLYEMLTGKKAFEGKSQLTVASAILEKEPAPISTVKPMTPPAMDHVIRRCLAKEQQKRWQNAADLSCELQWIAEGGSQAGAPSLQLPHHKLRERIAWTVAAVLAVVAIAFAVAFGSKGFSSKSPTTAMPVVRFDIPLTPYESSAFSFLTLDRGVTISADGNRIVFRVPGRSGAQLFLRNINASQSAAIPGTENAVYPFFSPDGESIGFFAAGKLKRVAFAGGAPAIVCDAQNLQGSAAWGVDGNIYFSSGAPWAKSTTGLWRVPADGGPPERIGVPVTDVVAEMTPIVLPGSDAILEGIWDGKGFDTWRIDALRVGTGERRTVLRNAYSPRFLSSGFLVFVRDANLFAVAFDPKRLEIRGNPVSVVEGVLSALPYGIAQYDVSSNGDLVFVGSGSSALQNHLVWRERDGKAHEIALPPNFYQAPRISPDGREVAVTVRNPDPDIWILNIARGTLRRVSFAPGEDEVPAWSPDGKRLAYASNSRHQLSWLPADGSAGEERLAPVDSHVHIGSWSPDGKLLIYESFSKTTNREIWVLPIEGDRKPYPYLQTSFDIRSPALSPDGQWLAYQSDESGQLEIYVQKFPGPGGKTQISTEGGTSPVWAKNGLELFYRNREKQMVVSISKKGVFTAGNPHVLFENPAWGWQSGPNYDVTPDGKRIIGVELGEEIVSSPLHVVLNWESELLDRMAAKKR